jgi:hypothetical protein
MAAQGARPAAAWKWWSLVKTLTVFETVFETAFETENATPTASARGFSIKFLRAGGKNAARRAARGHSGSRISSAARISACLSGKSRSIGRRGALAGSHSSASLTQRTPASILAGVPG